MHYENLKFCDLVGFKVASLAE